MPTVRKSEAVLKQRKKPGHAIKKASQNRILSGKKNSKETFESLVINKRTAGTKTRTVPGKMIIDRISPQCIAYSFWGFLNAG